VTRLLGEPLAQTLLHVFRRERRLLPGVFESMSHFIDDIEVLLDVLSKQLSGSLCRSDSTCCLAVDIVKVG
jgi:hypothetical protein